MSRAGPRQLPATAGTVLGGLRGQGLSALSSPHEMLLSTVTLPKGSWAVSEHLGQSGTGKAGAEPGPGYAFPLPGKPLSSPLIF